MYDINISLGRRIMSTINRILFVLKYIWENSDAEHSVTAKDIIRYLNDQGISATSKTIKNDVDQLIEFGIDIEIIHSTQNRYFLYERCFELAEMKLLIDAVQSARFITSTKSKGLINKLSKFASVHQKSELNRQLYVDKHIKSQSNRGYYSVEPIHAAIQNKKKVSFKYLEYMPDKTLKEKHNGWIYFLSPYSLIWNEDSYYVIGFSDSHHRIAKFRVDRMKDLDVLDEPAHKKPRDYSVANYFSRVFSMYDGPECEVQILCENETMKYIIDRFGENVTTSIVDGKHFMATVTVCLSPTFYGWIFSFTGKMKIVAPELAISGFNKMLDINRT